MSYEIVGGAIVDALRRQLERDPPIDANAANLFCIARASAEGQTIEYLLYLLVGEQLARRRRLERHGRLG
jgi:hypothetical protein